MKLPISLNDLFLSLLGLAVFILSTGSLIHYIKAEFDYKKWRKGNGK